MEFKKTIIVALAALLPLAVAAQEPLPSYTGDGKNWSIATSTGGSFTFLVNNAEALRVNAAGLSFDTIAASDSLQIQTDASVTGSNAIEIETNEATAEIRLRTGANDQIFQFNATGDLEIRDGNLLFEEGYAIRGTTADGSDTLESYISAGGGTTFGRGSFINLHGNEHATDPGEFTVFAGSNADVQNAIELKTQNATAGLRINTGNDAVTFDFEPDGDLDVEDGSVLISTAGKGLAVKTGSNAKVGTATCNEANDVAVANTSVTANSLIFLTAQNETGADPGVARVVSKTAGVGFSFNCDTASTTATMAYWIVEATP